MSKDKWCIEEKQYQYRIQWYLADEGDMGADFGGYQKKGLPPGHFPPDGDVWTLGHNAGVDAVIAAGLGRLGTSGFEFDALGEAKKALAILNTCMKVAQDGKPWPEWAIQAKAAGWKPPKAWKP